MHVGGPRVNIRCATAASGDMVSRELHLDDDPRRCSLFAPRRGTRSRDGETKPQEELSKIDPSHWYWWFTPEQAVAITPGLDSVEDLLNCDTPETTYHLVKEKAFDYRQAMPGGVTCLYFSSRPSVPAKNPPIIHLSNFASACHIIRRNWAGILDASSRLESGRVIYNIDDLSPELWTHNPKQRSGSVVQLAEQVDWDVRDCRTFFAFLKWLNSIWRFAYPTELTADAALYRRESAIPVHRRESLISKIEAPSGEESEESDASLEGSTDEESEDSRSPAFDFVQGRKVLAAMVAAREQPRKETPVASTSVPPGLPRDRKVALLREFGDALYLSSKGTA